MEDRNRSITRQSASHDASRIVTALIENSGIASNYGNKKSREEAREEIKEELQYWTNEFKYHARSGRWLDLDKEMDAGEMLEKLKDRDPEAQASDTLQRLKDQRPEIIEELSGEAIQQLKENLEDRYRKLQEEER